MPVRQVKKGLYFGGASTSVSRSSKLTFILMNLLSSASEVI